MFTGFTDATVDFLWGIRFNNERPWFEAHKETYLSELYRPMKDLGAEIYEFLSERRPEDAMMCRVSRIYRDARRLHGRGPYKDHLWFCVERPTEDWTTRPTFWFELGPDYWGYGMGCWMARPMDMAKLRSRIVRDPKPMEKLTKALRGQTEFTLGGDTYKRPKAGAPSELLAPWFQMKTISITHEEKLTEELFSRDVVDRIKTGYTFLLPYYDYFLTLPSDPEPETLKEVKQRSDPYESLSCKRRSPGSAEKVQQRAVPHSARPDGRGRHALVCQRAWLW